LLRFGGVDEHSRPVSTLLDEIPADLVLAANFDALRAEQVAGFYRNAAPGTIGGTFTAIILAGMLYLLARFHCGHRACSPCWSRSARLCG